MKSKIIAPGVKLCTHKTEQFKTSVVSFNIITNLGENAGKKALLLNLLARTSKTYPTVTAMNRRLAELYGAIISPSVRKIGESQVLSLVLICLDDRFSLYGEKVLEESIRLLSGCLFMPDITPDGFREENIRREKRLLSEKIDSEKDDKRIYALNTMLEEMCRDEVYGTHRLGTKEEIESATGKELLSIWKDLLFNSPIQINITGSFDENAIEETVTGLFAPLERKKENISPVYTEFLTEAYESRIFRQKQPVKQGKLVIGMRAGMTYKDDNFPAIKLMNAIFGSGTFSKLFMNVREKMSLCYYCAARLDSNKGIITVESGVETENAEKALEAIRNELDEVRRGNFTDETVENAKKSLSDLYNSVYDSVMGINDWMTSLCTSNELTEPSVYGDMINAVCREEIIIAASMVTEDTVFILESEKEDA
ncbi:MAG: insulinase family protein [Ruminococcaceae bacterium]|nr:insulinase family protein [Oscillospiraceae bacterium]